MHHNILDAIISQRSGDRLSHLLRVTIHAAINNNHAFLTFVAAHTVIDIDRFRRVFTPNRSMGRANRLDIQARKLL